MSHKANILNVDYFHLDPIYLDFPCEIHFTRFGKCSRLHNEINPIVFENTSAYKVFVSSNEPAHCPSREPGWRIIQNSHQYDLILTTDEDVLSSVSNSVLFPYGTTWLGKNKINHNDSLGRFDDAILEQIQNKENNISFMTTNHFGTPGYSLRRIIWNNRNLIKYPTLFYSSTRFITNQPTWNGLLFSNTIHDGLLPNDDKINLFKSKFSIAIENNKEKWYFSEKLIDCLVTKTVPIYWGCSDVGKFFDTRGMITFDTPEEFVSKVNSITETTYDEMSPYIEKNYELAKEYSGSIFERVKKEIMKVKENAN
jgi:hypothetical protein